MRDKRKPIAFGAMQNLTPAFVDGIFWFNDGRVDSAVFYENGRPLDNPIVDYPDVLDLMIANVPPGTYATCRAYAAIKFGDNHPDGMLTADVTNTNAGMALPPEEGPEILPPQEEDPLRDWGQMPSDRSVADIVADVTQQAQNQLDWAAKPLDDLVERFAIRCARGNNGGEWATHYTEDQKNFWRQFVRDLIADIQSPIELGKIHLGDRFTPVTNFKYPR